MENKEDVMKKLAVWIVAILLVFSGFAGSVSANGFKDLKTGHRFYNEIMYLVDKGIVSGYTDQTFRYEAAVTRAQAAVMLGRAKGFDGTPSDTKFSDVKKGNFGSGYINDAVEAGIILGYPDGTFRPNQTVTRGQMAIFIARAFDLKEEAQTDFLDVKPGMKAYSSAKKIIAAGITTGYPNNTFRPDKTLRRSDFSAFLARALNEEFQEHRKMTVYFVSGGDTDYAVIRKPNNNLILIDSGGINSTLLEDVNNLNFGTGKIDLIVSTTPQEDHIAGLNSVLKAYKGDIGKVIHSGMPDQNAANKEFLSLIEQYDIPVQVAEEGKTLIKEDQFSLQALNAYDEGESIEEGAMALKMTYRDFDTVFTGEINGAAEQKLLENHNVEAEILQIANHRDSSANSQAFIDAVGADITFINDEQGIDPYPELLERLRNADSDIYHGVLSIVTDGETYQEY